MDNLILTTEKNGLLTITLNRIDKKNALTSAMYLALKDHFIAAQENNDIRCLLIQGDENCFCSGNDLADFLNHQAGEELAASKFIASLAQFTKPIVVAVAGPAIGIGTTLLLHSDIVVAANNTTFALPFTKLGLCPEAGSSALLPQLVGHAKAFELLVLGDSFNAEQALAMNLINKVVEPTQLLSTANDYANKILSLPNDAVMKSRELLKNANKLAVKQAFASEMDYFEQLMLSDECKSILQSFFK